LKIEVDRILDQARHDPDKECGKQGKRGQENE